MRVAACLIAVTLLTGCENACQQLCEHLAEYGEQSCDYPYDEAQVQACKDDFANPTRDDLRTCVQYGTPERLRREWTCDDVRAWQDLPE